MAIRPVDLQGSIFQTTQQSAAARQAEAAPIAAQTAVAAEAAKKVEERNETVTNLEKNEGNRVREREYPDTPEGRERKRRDRRAGEPFEDLDEGLALADGEHLIDFTA